MAIDDSVRALVDLRDRTLQKSRIAFGNRVDAITRGADVTSEEAQKIIAKWGDLFDTLEAEADKDIKKLVKHEPIIQELVELKGIGFLLAAKMVAMIDIHRAETVSALWRYSGYGVTDGARDKPTPGQKLCYNSRLKTTLYLVAGSFLKANSPYRRVYDDSRAFYEANRPDWTKAHQHQASMRRMIKLFLSHLYARWRALEGLPVRAPYVHEKLGHTHLEQPETFGWKDAAREGK